MKIIDIARKGNVIRFYLGEKTGEWGWTNPDYTDAGGRPEWLEPSDRYYGDDWNDVPFEHNAGKVYDEFIKGVKDVSYPFDSIILEPDDGELNSKYCMDDLVDRKAPRLLIISKEAQDAIYDGGNGHATWYYGNNYAYAKEAIAAWESENGKKLEGVQTIYLGDEI